MVCYLRSASVLDRLNALLEPKGSLTISERGVIDGKTPQISPHPNFRFVMGFLIVEGIKKRVLCSAGECAALAGCS